MWKNALLLLLLLAAHIEAVQKYIMIPKRESGMSLEDLETGLKKCFGSTLQTIRLQGEIQFWYARTFKYLSCVRQKYRDVSWRWRSVLDQANGWKQLEWATNESILRPWEDESTLETSLGNLSNTNDVLPLVDTRYNGRGGTLIQHDGPLDLTMISWPNDYTFPGFNRQIPRRGYIYEGNAGEGTFIYLVDTGVHTAHREFASMPNPPTDDDWIISGDTDQTRGDDDEPNLNPRNPRDYKKGGHGTCTASKAVGYGAGVVKKARLVIVKNNFTLFSIMSAFVDMANDIISKGRQGKAVIALPWGTIKEFDTRNGFDLTTLPQPYAFIRDVVYRLRDLDVPIVCAAGNKGALQATTFSSIMANNEQDAQTAVIVASATNLLGDWAEYSQIYRRRLWAPGEVICARTKTVGEYDWRDGTSYATPLVAGMIAYFLSNPNPPWGEGPAESLTLRIHEWMWEKSSRPFHKNFRYPNVIWNQNKIPIPQATTTQGALLNLKYQPGNVTVF